MLPFALGVCAAETARRSKEQGGQHIDAATVWTLTCTDGVCGQWVPSWPQRIRGSDTGTGEQAHGQRVIDHTWRRQATHMRRPVIGK